MNTRRTYDFSVHCAGTYTLSSKQVDTIKRAVKRGVYPSFSAGIRDVIAARCAKDLSAKHIDLE